MRLLASIIGVLLTVVIARHDDEKSKQDFDFDVGTFFNISGLSENAIEALDGVRSLYHLFFSPDAVLKTRLSEKRMTAKKGEDVTLDTRERRELLRDQLSVTNQFTSSETLNKQSATAAATTTTTSTSAEQHHRRMLSESAPAVNCSGVGIKIRRRKSTAPIQPTPSTLLYTCNNVRVSRLAHDAIIASKDDGSGVPVIKAATLAAGLSAEGPSITRDGILLSEEPLPSVIKLADRLSLQQQALVARDANVEDIEEVLTMGQLFSDALIEDTLNLAAMLASLTPSENAALLINTTCASSPAPVPPSQGNDEESVCVCPHDYFGPNCEFGMAIACGVVISDPLYNVCVGINGVGFEVPKQIPLGQVSVAAISSRITDVPMWLKTTANDLMGLTETTAGPASFTEAKLPPKQGSDGFDDILAGTAVKGYRPLVPGHPPCLFVDRSLAKTSPSSSSSSTSSSSSSAFINVRVSCVWQRENVTTRMSSGRTLVDEYGDAYAIKLPILNTTRTRAREVIESVLREAAALAPTVPQFVPVHVDELNRNPPGVLRCNGSALTLSYIDARVTNRTASVLRGNGPPFFGMNCIEQQFSYSVGGIWAPQTDADASTNDRNTPFSSPFSISSIKFRGGAPLEGGLAVRFSPFSPTFVMDSSLTTLTRIPVNAMDGSRDIQVPFSVKGQGAWAKEDAFWAGGRLFAEASVVHAAVGIAPDEVTSLIRDGALVTNATSTLAQEIRKFLVPDKVFSYSAIPRLVLTNVLPVMIDDSSYVEPVAETMLSRALRLFLTVALPLLIVIGIPILWWQRRKRILDEVEEPEAAKED